MLVAGGPVSADANTEGAGTAALPLSLPNGVQDALMNSLPVAIRPPQVIQRAREEVLDILVFAAAAFQNEPHLYIVPFPLLEMDDGSSRAQVVPAVFSGKRVDR